MTGGRQDGKKQKELAVRDQFEGEVFSTGEVERIRTAVKDKYGRVAQSAAGLFGYPTGREGARNLGYDAGLLDRMSDDLLDSFCGVGNPFAIAPIDAGSAVLDIGCGAGLDLLVAMDIVGQSGRVCGIDLSAEMIDRARRNLRAMGRESVEAVVVEDEELPYDDGSFDVVISNGVINLSPRKGRLFAEVHRVLRPGGRLQFADIVLDGTLPPGQAGSVEAWSQ